MRQFVNGKGPRVQKKTPEYIIGDDSLREFESLLPHIGDLVIDNVGAIIIRDKKILIVREEGLDTFIIPGGRRDGNESDEDVLKRELLEEISTSPKNIKFYREFQGETLKTSDVPNDIVKVKAYFCDIDDEPKPGEEIEEIMWVDKDSQVKMGSILRLLIPELVIEGYL